MLWNYALYKPNSGFNNNYCVWCVTDNLPLMFNYLFLVVYLMYPDWVGVNQMSFYVMPIGL